jgi:3-hydroxyisobutyrate dehydrogenase-like beta-hydroxyacid dehydrogenase
MTPQELDSHSSQDKGTQHPPKEGRAAWPRTVGIVGLGHMGTAFALNLLADGYPVLAHDRNPASLEMVRLVGAHVVNDIGGLAACDLVLTSLPDDEALKTVCLTGLLRTLHAGAVHVSTSTVSPGLSRLLATEHGKSGQGFVAAPVLGNPDLALARKLKDC